MKLPPEALRLLRELKPSWVKILIIATSGIVMSLGAAFLSQLTEPIFNSFDSQSYHRILEVAYLIIGLTVVINIARFVHLYLMDVLSDQVTVDLQRRLQQKILYVDMSYLERFKSGGGGLMSRVFNDLAVVQSGLRLVADFFREPLLFVLLIGILFWRDWKLTAALLVVGPLLSVLLKQLSRSLRKYAHKSSEALETVTSTLKESLDGARTIQSYNLQEYLRDKFRAQTEIYLAFRTKIHARYELSSPVSETIATILLLGMCLYMGKQISLGLSTTGEFVAYLSAVLWLQKPVRKLQESFIKVQQTLVALQRVYEVLDYQGTVESPKSSRPFPNDVESVCFKNVTFAYDKKNVLDGIDFTFKKGEIVAFVGSSGSGKSTLVSLLPRFFDPTQGQVEINGIDIKKFDLQDLRKHIAVVSQDTFLFQESLRHNILAGDLSKSPETLEQAAKSANAWDFIQNSEQGLLTPVGDRGNFLSGGQKQRISIARALFKDAPLLILDEATSALDTESEREVQVGLEQLMKGRTVLIVAHRLSTIQKADRIVVMKDGRITEVGTHSELLENASGEYTRFYNLQK